MICGIYSDITVLLDYSFSGRPCGTAKVSWVAKKVCEIDSLSDYSLLLL